MSFNCFLRITRKLKKSDSFAMASTAYQGILATGLRSGNLLSGYFGDRENQSIGV